MTSFFAELSVVMVAVLLISLFMKKVRQPLLIGYILTGILMSPLFFNVLSSEENYEAFAHIGIALLLFIVGLNLNVKLIKEVGFISLVTGLGQVFFTSLVGFFIGLALGFNVISSLLLAIALTFSSTIIIVKLLSDKKEMDTLYGRISMGFLLVQDFVAVFLLMVIASFLGAGEGSIISTLSYTILLALCAIFLTFVLGRYIVPRFLTKIVSSQELLFIFVIAWCFGFAALFDSLGFSLEIGALLAGITLASTSYQFEISAKVKPLRDFFIVMFFILLGSQMIPPLPAEILSAGLMFKLSVIWAILSPLMFPAILLSLFVLIGNPLIVLFLMTRLGYSSKTGFLAGLTVAQISEFSLILGLMAQEAGFLSNADLSLLTLVGIFTITGSTYLILNGDYLYAKFAPLIRKLEKKNLKDRRQGVQGEKYDILIFGYDRIGFSLVKTMDKMKMKYLVVDHDPQMLARLSKEGVNAMYGDASNPAFISEFDFKDVRLIISTIPDQEVSMILIESLRRVNEDAVIILTANQVDYALELYEEGADYVILPHFLGGEYVAGLIDRYGEDFREFLKEKISHIDELKKRKDFGQEHPRYEH